MIDCDCCSERPSSKTSHNIKPKLEVERIKNPRLLYRSVLGNNSLKIYDYSSERP